MTELDAATPLDAKSAATARAIASLQGLALGDALGMPTQSMSRAEIVEDYGPEITRFLAAGPRQRIAAGMSAGLITDDTEQAVLLAKLLINGNGSIDQREFADALLAWEATMKAKGSLDLLGPSTKVALQRLEEGFPPEVAGSGGTTNGAAMRIAPVGIAVDASNLTTFVDAVAMASGVTHNSSIGLGAAAAVGAAVSVGVAGGSIVDACRTAIAAAAEAERRAPWAAGGTIAARLAWAIPFLGSTPSEARRTVLTEIIGTSVAAQESVVAAMALAATAEDPWTALATAAGAGGDTDTVAAIAGAVIGATSPTPPWPTDRLAELARANDLPLTTLATALVELRFG